MADVNGGLPPDDGWLLLKGLVGPCASVALGVLWRRTEEVRSGKRWSWRACLLDGPSVIGLGIICDAAARWLGLGEEARLAASCAAGYLGTAFLIERVLPRVLNRIGPAPTPEG